MTDRVSISKTFAGLVASDQAYFQYGTLATGTDLKPLIDGPMDVPEYASPLIYRDVPQFSIPPGFTVAAVIERPDVGAKAIIYQNPTTRETIVSFGGTDGFNPQDYVANSQSFGWSQWDRLNTSIEGSDSLLNQLMTWTPPPE
jgi:hypothetical protein